MSCWAGRDDAETVGRNWARPGDHLSALWWLALLYRKPRQFLRAVEALGRLHGDVAGLSLCVHSWPHVVLLGLAGRLALTAALGLPVNRELIFEGLRRIGGGIVVWIVVGIKEGIAAGGLSRILCKHFSAFMV